MPLEELVVGHVSAFKVDDNSSERVNSQQSIFAVVASTAGWINIFLSFVAQLSRLESICFGRNHLWCMQPAIHLMLNSYVTQGLRHLFLLFRQYKRIINVNFRVYLTLQTGKNRLLITVLRVSWTVALILFEFPVLISWKTFLQLQKNKIAKTNFFIIYTSTHCQDWFFFMHGQPT